MKLVMASDHGGFELKELLKAWLQEEGYEIDDVGTHSNASVDYPRYAKKAAEVILEKKCLGIMMCGTGIGISVSANKINGIRAALCSEEFSARMARAHNNANVLCLGGRTVGFELAKSIIKSFLETEFEAGRHARRVDLMMKLEQSQLDVL